ncbi:hypothetical protein NQ314_021023 [Rhamnusium bicolor]|uniref:PiggyBac transposable element-derived protein domain-containing protein n=1 Tax=Rhamnusium bicolor TaxID=1586634 RepID=A0AAV8WJ63_9CUCU|nr:hypothetical protein NQ314_021023 [Rhamnusium bicolor]
MMVLRLVEPIRNSGRNITGDNLYSSIELMSELQKQKLTYVGTVKKNKRFIPLEFMPSSERDVNSSSFGFTKHETIVSFIPKKKENLLFLYPVCTMMQK